MIRQICALLAIATLLASPNVVATSQIWQPIDSQTANLQSKSHRPNQQVAKQSFYQMDAELLQNRLAAVPLETTGDHSQQLELPMPDGRITRFEIVGSPIMHTGANGESSSFQSYKVKGVDDPTMSGRVSLSQLGFNGFLISGQDVILVHAEDPELNQYASKLRAKHHGGKFSCGTHAVDDGYSASLNIGEGKANRIATQLLEYDIAVAATREYVAEVGSAGDTATAQAAIEIAIQAVNVYYERDHGIRLKLLDLNENLIETGTVGISNVGVVIEKATFSDDEGFTMLDENQTWIDWNLAEGNISNYDIGHVFSTGGGGVANLSSVCDTSRKAGGVTGLPNSAQLTSDLFYVDYVAHEIGHQFGATHTFNGTSGACADNREPSTALEPGSGSSIMAYANICGAEDIQGSSSPTFHAGSIEQVHIFTTSGGNCGTTIATSPVNNIDPSIVTASIDSSNNHTIPYGTPFQLGISATDLETIPSVLTYQWDQMDAGTETDATNLGLDLVTNALFRTYVPENRLASRDFPALGTQVNGLYDVSEALPCQSRGLNFRATVRDGDSGQDTADLLVNVTRQAGPFKVTSQAVSQNLAADFTVTWDVADTNNAPVSCSTISIDLLAFDNATYENYSVHSLLAGTANDGTELVSLPANILTAPARGRLRVMCDNNVFYALSEGDLTFSGGAGLAFDSGDNLTFHNDTNGTTVAGTFVCGSGFKFGDPDFTGASDPWWWLMLAGGIASINRFRRQTRRV